MPWYQSGLAVLLGAVLLPPLGILLLWLRPGVRIPLRIFGTLLIAILGLVQLFQVYGLRMELDGAAVPRFFTFQSPEDRDRAIEESRAAQKAAHPPAAPFVPPASSPEPAPAARGVLGVSQTPPVAAKPAPAAAPAPEAPRFRNYWTDFRGPNRMGHYEEQPLLDKWPEQGLKRLWKHPVGGGYASFVIADGMAFTIEQRRDQEVVAAYDLLTGTEKWTNSWKAHFSESMGGDGPRTTPVYDEGRIYALGAEGELRCIDAATGQTVWNKNILKENEAANLTWAQAASPLISGGMLLTLPGGSKGRSVVAYRKTDGEILWTALDDEQSYTSPVEVTLGGRRQFLIVTATRVVGLAVGDGTLLWEFPWVTEYHVNASQPIVAGPDRFFISAGYGHGAALVELTPDGGRFTARAVWRNTRMKTKFNSPVLYQGHVYGLDEGILACVELATGEQKWKGGRYGYGQVLLAGGRLIILTEQGDLALVNATPAGHQQVSRFSAISGKTWNNPAISAGILLVRNESEMAAFKVGVD